MFAAVNSKRAAIWGYSCYGRKASRAKATKVNAEQYLSTRLGDFSPPLILAPLGPGCSLIRRDSYRPFLNGYIWVGSRQM